MKTKINKFSSFLKNLSKTVDTKQKKNKSGSRKQTDYSAEYTALEKHIVDVKKVTYIHVLRYHAILNAKTNVQK